MNTLYTLHKNLFSIRNILMMLVIGTLPCLSLQAGAQSFEITLTIDQVDEVDCFDPTLWWCDQADFYPEVQIGSENFTAATIDNDSTARPSDWEFKAIVGPNDIAIDVRIFDEDGWFRGGDDQADITSNGGQQLDFTFNPQDCTFAGDATGSCGSNVLSTGNSGDRARIRFQMNAREISIGEVEVIVERLTGLDCVDSIFGICLSPPDHYGIISIDGTSQSNRDADESDLFADHDDASPYWKFVDYVPFDSATIPVSIRIEDADSNDDDTIDVSPVGRHLNVDLSVNSAGNGCTISGEDTGSCGDILNVNARMDTSGTSNDRARMQSRINVYERPRVNIACSHDPIWPMPGENVTFTAQTFDANMQPLRVEEIRILQPSRTRATCTNSSNCSVVLSTSEAFQYRYACEADTMGHEYSSGSRVSTIGQPNTGTSFPLIRHHADTSDAVDFVFFPDDDSYSSATDDDFIEDVGDVINEAYYGFDLYLRNQNRINFWVGTDTGQANGFGNPDNDPCLVAPASMNTTFAFADVGIILHTDTLRDCATGRNFTSEPDSIRTVRHETGHRPFALSDEYCCDGGYSQNTTNPNIYGPQTAGDSDALNACLADSLGGLRGSCGVFTSTRVSENDEFVRLDHDPQDDDPGVKNDLMLDNRVPRAADERRIQQIFDNF